MLNAIRAKMTGEGIGARVRRGSMLTFVGYAGGQLIRLASNLILTRLLFPEAFGLMTIVTVFLTGIQMVSDIGLHACIIRSKRGDDPVFLNTAWVLQILRHVILAAICVAVAGPVARFYGEPILHEMMYAVAVAVFLMGLKSSRIATANRKIHIGRMTVLEMTCQVLSIATMIGLALVWHSVWALMVGMIVSHLAKAILSHVDFVMPGQPNRFQWEWEAFWEQFHFGKYLFISSGVSFLIDNGDRILLSKFLSLAYLGFYNIAFFFASVPKVLMGQLVHKVLYPLYSARPPAESAANRRDLSKTRFALTGGMFAMLFVLGLIGQWLIDFLYTEEYQDAGPILVLLAVSLMPGLIIQNYPQLILAVGGSGVYMGFQVFRAVLQTGLLAVGLLQFGLIGAMASAPLSALLTYPVMIWLIRPYKGEDYLHDGFFAAIAALCMAAVFWVNGDAVERVLHISEKGHAEALAQEPDATPLGE